MIGYGSVQILHDETVATGIRNGAKMVVEGGVYLCIFVFLVFMV